MYRLTASGAGLVTLVVLFLIGLFLLLRALPTFRENGLSFFTSTGWNPAVPHETGVAALLYGTLVVATIALVLAVPVSLLTALYLTEYVPPRMRAPLVTMLDLLAAVPSLIYGIWGFFFLQPRTAGRVAGWLTDNLGFIPFFATPGDPNSRGVAVHRRRAGRADADPHRHAGDARGVLPDAARREGGGARPGRHPLGR